MSLFIDLVTPAELALDFSRWVGDIILIPEKLPKMTDLLLPFLSGSFLPSTQLFFCRYSSLAYSSLVSLVA